MKKLAAKIYTLHKRNQKQSWFLIVICFIFILLRIPSLIEPHWYGDEGIYQVVGMALNDGRVLYKEIWDNKPPLLYIFYAVLNSNLFLVKLFSLIFGVASVIVFNLIARRLFQKEKAIYLSTIVYSLLFAIPILEGNIANAENFMLLPVVLSSYFLLSFVDSKSKKTLILSGLLLSFALITKIVAIFDFAAFLLFILFALRANKDNYKNMLIFSLSFLSLIIVSSFYFLVNGAFINFVNGVFLQNVSYVGEQYGAASPELMLFLKTVLLSIGVLLLFFFRKSMSLQSLFIFLWLIFGVYSSLFSDRPYTHYLLVILPPFALLVGSLLEAKRLQLVGLAIIVILYLLSYYHFGIYRKNIAYYRNFVDFITNSKTTFEYEAFFDANTPRDYALVSFINHNTLRDQHVFLWSDSAQIYAMSKKLPIGKYAVAYHISTYENAVKETRQQIEKLKPKYIIQTSEVDLYKEFLYSYRLRYIMEGAKIYEREI